MRAARSGAIQASAKKRIGIDEILEAIVARVPAPADTSTLPLRALIFDSYYDSYKRAAPARARSVPLCLRAPSPLGVACSFCSFCVHSPYGPG